MLGDFTWDVVEKEAECLSQRFKAVTRNMANANTPGYARRNVSFEDQMREVMENDRKLHMSVTSPNHIPSYTMRMSDVRPAEIRVLDEQYRLDGNNVDPEREQAVLAETRMMYNAMMRIAHSKASSLRMVIAG